MMILRTPPRKRRAESGHPKSPNSDVNLVIFEDVQVPEPSNVNSEQMLCTYQCRQMVKSEFLDALSSAEKLAVDYKTKLEAQNDEFCKVEAESKKFRDLYMYAEQELAAAKGREQALQERFLKEVNGSQEQLKKKMHIHSELEIKLQNEMNLRKKAESALGSAEEKAKVLEEKISYLSESSERERSRLQLEVVYLEKESKLSVSRISADLERMECRANNAEKESLLLRDQLEELRRRLNECLHQKKEAEKTPSTSASQECPSTDSNILVKHLREELRNYQTEVREARKLRLSHENIDLLKEKLLEEKGRRERSESELHRLSEIRVAARKLEDELTSWKLVIQDFPGISCPDDIPLQFAAMQKEVVENMIKVGEANSQVKEMEVALDAAKLGKQNAENDVKLAREKAELSKMEVKRMELMLSSVVEERDWLKNVVHELRQQVNGEAGEAGSGIVFQELESSLAKKESYIKELERNLCELKEVTSHQHNEINLLTERLNSEARIIKSLEREGDRLRSEIVLLESKLGHGDYSTASTKVLRMVNSLAVDNEAKKAIEALQTELQKTKEKLQAIEELKRQSVGSGLIIGSDIAAKIVQLEKQIATLEKREQRYKTVFADRISVFRRACCALFGYKIVMDEHQRSDGIAVTRFTLQSIYAQSEDETLQFEYESGNLKILGNDYVSLPEISQQVEVFIRRHNSIPAFTANLIVESFNRQTLS